MPHLKSFTMRTAFCLCAAALELPSSGCLFNDQDAGDNERSLRSARLQMVEEQLRYRGIRDERVLQVMSEIPRHRFVPKALQFSAYDDGPLPIGEGQTISQPYIVALMSENLALKGTETVLEIGTGSGYQAAVLSRLAKQIYSIEIIPELAESARERLQALGVTNVKVIIGDGNEGWAEGGPYEAIIVTAVAPEIPPALLAQLADGGRMVLPVEKSEEQYLMRLQKRGGQILEEDLGPVRFVPLVGGTRESKKFHR